MQQTKSLCKTCQRKLEFSKGTIIPKCGICKGKLCRLDAKECSNVNCGMTVCEDDRRRCAKCDDLFCKNCVKPMPARRTDGSRVFLCDIHYMVV